MSATVSAPDAADPLTNRILDTALQDFETFGLRATTVQNIARRGGFARKSVYRRFANKRALVEAVVWREATRLVVDIDAAVSVLPTIEDRLIEGFALAVRAARSHRVLRRVVTTEPDVMLSYLTTGAGPALAMAHALTVDRIHRFFNGATPSFDVDAVAELLLRLGQSCLLTPEIAIRFDDEQQARAIAHRWLDPILILR
jgi:AcrR family transcriptional regulator